MSATLSDVVDAINAQATENYDYTKMLVHELRALRSADISSRKEETREKVVARRTEASRADTERSRGMGLLGGLLLPFTLPLTAIKPLASVATHALSAIFSLPLGILGILSKALVPLGIATGGFGLMVGAFSMFLNSLATFDSEAVKQNVLNLLSIADADNGGWGRIFGVGTVLGVLGASLTSFGIGAAVGSGGDMLARWMGGTDWSETIKTNVLNLLSIADMESGGWGRIFGVYFVLRGLGESLKAFGIGSTIGATSDMLNRWMGGSVWSENIKTNVLNLLGMFHEVDAPLEKAANAMAALAMLGVGLFFFGIGGTINAASSGLNEIVEYFGSGADWSKTVVKNVRNLLSLTEDPWDLARATGVAGALGLIGIGLAAFAIGKGLNAAADAMAQTLSLFTQEGWADVIVSNVDTLLSLVESGGSITFMSGEGFISGMAAIATGLIVFGIGKGLNVSVDAYDRVLTLFYEGDVIDRVVSGVDRLMTMTGQLKLDDTVKFRDGMTNIALGLGALAAGEGVSSVLGAYASFVDFFNPFDNKGPMGVIVEFASHAPEIYEAGDSLLHLAGALDRFSEIDFSNMTSLNMERFARDLSRALPHLELAVMGGTIRNGAFGGSTVLRGLGSSDVPYEAAARNLAALRGAMGLDISALPTSQQGGLLTPPEPVGTGTVLLNTTNVDQSSSASAQVNNFTSSPVPSPRNWYDPATRTY